MESEVTVGFGQEDAGAQTVAPGVAQGITGADVEGALYGLTGGDQERVELEVRRGGGHLMFAVRREDLEVEPRLFAPVLEDQVTAGEVGDDQDDLDGLVGQERVPAQFDVHLHLRAEGGGGQEEEGQERHGERQAKAHEGGVFRF